VVKEEKPEPDVDFLPVPCTITSSDLIFHHVRGLKLVTHSVTLVVADFLQILGPQLHRLMKRVYQRIGPHHGHVDVPRSIARVVFENVEEMSLPTTEAIINFLGTWHRRQYGFSYALLQPPFTMKWYATSGRVKFTFDYLVYTEEGRVISDGRGFS
jgi:hypothetical protein